MAAGETRSALPALPGSLRTAGGIMAASPACPVPSSTASRSPTAQQRPTRSVGSVCRGEWDRILARVEPRWSHPGTGREGMGRGGFI